MQISKTTLYTYYKTNKPSFKGTDTIVMPNPFQIDTTKAETNAKAPNFLQRCGELKKYNMNTAGLLTIAAMDKYEYEFVLGKLRGDFTRNQALINKDSKLNFTKMVEDFCGVKNANIKDTAYNFSYSNGYGEYSYKEMSTKRGRNKLSVIREYDNYRGGTTSNFTDRSRFNQDYTIQNSYTDTDTWEETHKSGTLRNISIKGYAGTPILKYTYMRNASKDLSEYTVNNRKYKVKVSKDGVAAVTSGNKGENIDFSDKIDDKVSKETFIEALKMLPPQILLTIGDSYDKIKTGSGKHDDRTLYVNSSSPVVASQIMINDTLEMLFYKHGLDKDEKLINLYKKEREEFIEWLENPKENCLKKGEEAYLKEFDHRTTEEELLETVKKTCKLLWTEEYGEGKANDEEMRLLLNFFPKTVSYLVTTFELNAA